MKKIFHSNKVDACFNTLKYAPFFIILIIYFPMGGGVCNGNSIYTNKIWTKYIKNPLLPLTWMPRLPRLLEIPTAHMVAQSLISNKYNFYSLCICWSEPYIFSIITVMVAASKSQCLFCNTELCLATYIVFQLKKWSINSVHYWKMREWMSHGVWLQNTQHIFQC